ncbi:MAG: thiamine pyrophosphate-requiring protein [Beijerinckiaceae bacterium]
MNMHQKTGDTVAQTYMQALAEYGVKHVFANGGTDFAPIIEGILQSQNTGAKLPDFVTVPHENVAVAMAQGYYKVSGEMAGVMVHVNVGTANTVCAVMNAARDNVPILLAAGRTPVTESGHAGSRNVGIHWAQENFDQGAILREHVKWDYELREGQPVDAIVGRALDIAMSEPRGPVYLTLPREVLGNPALANGATKRARPLGNVPAVPSVEALEKAADVIAAAEYPLIVVSGAARNHHAFHALGKLASEHAIAVSAGAQHSMATSNPMNLGPGVVPLLKNADVVVVIDSPVPWIPRFGEPNPNAKLIHIGHDPMFARYPYRGFEMDHAIAGDPGAALDMLNEMLKTKLASKKDAVEARRKKILEQRAVFDDRRRAAIEQGASSSPMSYAWVAHCVNQVKGAKDIVSDELGIGLTYLDMDEPGTFLSTSSGALGMGLGQALGAKVAAPDRQVISTVGDGSYMFGVPSAAHFVGKAENLPTLTIIMNNSQWWAVRRATVGMYPDGLASKANSLPIVDLTPSPDYEKITEAFGGYGERVEDPEKMLPALERAYKKLQDGQQVTINAVVRTRDVH